MKKKISFIIIVAIIMCSIPTVSAVNYEETNNQTFSVSEFNFETCTETYKEFAPDGSVNVTYQPTIKNNSTDFEISPLKTFDYVDRLDNDDEDFIIENDQRVLVDDTEQWPYSAIVYLKIKWETGDVYRGTGFLVSDNVVVTAAHNLYDPDKGGWADSVKAFPGKDGNGLFDNPYGSTKAYKGGVCSEWQQAKDTGLTDEATKELLRQTDWGAVVLIRSLGKKTGTINMRIPTAAELIRIPTVTVSGYPLTVNNTVVHQQYKMSSPIRNFDDSQIFYNLQTSGGQSGAPIFDENNIAIGIHTRSWGDIESNIFKYASGVRFTENIMHYLNLTITEHA